MTRADAETIRQATTVQQAKVQKAAAQVIEAAMAAVNQWHTLPAWPMAMLCHALEDLHEETACLARLLLVVKAAENLVRVTAPSPGELEAGTAPEDGHADTRGSDGRRGDQQDSGNGEPGGVLN